MRLAFLADASLVHTQRWVNAFAARGHACLLASLERGEGYACRTVWLRDRASLPRFARYTLEIAPVRRVLRDFRPDVVNAHFLPNYGWMAVHAAGRPRVLTTLGSDILTVPRQSALHAWRTRYVLRHCDAVTADAAMLARAIEAFGVAPERILMVPFGIEAERFATPAPRPDTPFVLLSTRRLEPVYDVETFLRACTPFVAAVGAGVEIHVAGNGSREAALRELAASLPVRFLGWLSQPDLDAALRRAHVYVSTSRSDSTSVSLLEAMAAGLFPVVSDIIANREWIVDGGNGLLFPCGDAEALAHCLVRARNEPRLRAAAAERNRRIVAERATWDVTVRQVEALFERLAAGAQRTRLGG